MSKVSNFFAAIRNLKNWGEYNFNKTKRKHRLLNFVTKPTALKFEVDEESFHVFKEIFVEDFYDIRTIFKLIPANPVIVDIGANTGFFELLVLSKRPKAIIYAYEPFASNIILIKNKLDANPKFKPQVKIFEKAVTDVASGTTNIYVDSTVEQSAIASIYPTFDTRNVNSFTVATTSLTEILEQNSITQIDVLKMDCEGAEYDILYTTPPENLKRVKLILLEVHKMDDGEKNIHGLERFLQKNGFTFFTKEFRNGCFYTYAINKHG